MVLESGADTDEPPGVLISTIPGAIGIKTSQNLWTCDFCGLQWHVYDTHRLLVQKKRFFGGTRLHDKPLVFNIICYRTWSKYDLLGIKDEASSLTTTLLGDGKV